MHLWWVHYTSILWTTRATIIERTSTPTNPVASSIARPAVVSLEERELPGNITSEMDVSQQQSEATSEDQECRIPARLPESEICSCQSLPLTDIVGIRHHEPHNAPEDG